MAARVLRVGTQIPDYGIPNPAGGAHSAGGSPVARVSEDPGYCLSTDRFVRA